LATLTWTAPTSGARLFNATLGIADLSRANLSGADLHGADLTGADLTGANLTRAVLAGAKLTAANLTGANLTNAELAETIFANVNLTSVIGLETCTHHGPSVIDHRTLERSCRLPLPFLRGVGLPDKFIDYLPSLLDQAIQHYSCFISYSAKDHEFAERLHADLQNKGVRCWFAPDDLRIGDKILDEIDAAIRLRDKVLLILSEHSIKSDWVEDEVTAGFEEERKRGQIVLFPVRLDETVMKTNEAWAAKLRARRIGDFQHWKDHDAYKDSFERVLRDLTIKS
jgi:TIR domain/Pentapeptide repeats (8 copies)